METYIVRIHRRQDEAESQVSVGIVEDAETGKTKKFAGPGELLKILKFEKSGTCEDLKSKQKQCRRKSR